MKKISLTTRVGIFGLLKIALCQAQDLKNFFNFVRIITSKCSVTNRDQGDPTFELAQQNLISAGFPMVDSEHLTVLRETSNEEIQKGIMEDYEVVVMLGIILMIS